MTRFSSSLFQLPVPTGRKPQVMVISTKPRTCEYTNRTPCGVEDSAARRSVLSSARVMAELTHCNEQAADW
jgi:hypothetical protein